MFARLFLLIGLVSGLSLCTVAGLLWRSSVELERQLHDANTSAGTKVIRQGTELLEENLRNTHLTIVQEKARKVEAYFANIAGAVQLESSLARQFLTDGGSPADAPTLFEANELTRMAQAKPELRETLISTQPYVIYHLAPGVSRSKTNDSLNRLRRLGAFFAHTQHAIPGCDSTYFGSAEGYILGYPGGKTFFKAEYDPRKRPWYTEAINGRSAIWIVNVDRDGKSLLLTCARPVRLSESGPAVGVAAIDVRIPNVLTELFNVGQLSVSRAILIDETGRVRVSAAYDQAKLSFDRRDLLNMPPVEKLSERGFARVAAKIRANSRQSSGILWDGASMAKSQSAFIYTGVRFSSGDDASESGASGQSWYYIVQLPVKSLFKPIDAVTGEISDATQTISTAIKDRTRRSAAIIMGVIGLTLLAALSVAYFAARATSRPLIQMASVARSVGQGDLDREAVETSGGEIGELGRAINAMIHGLKQRDLLKDTFGRYVAPTVVDEVLRKGDVELGGKKRVVTVFFSDLVGFTTLAEQTPPEALVQLLNEYFDAMTKIVLESEGTLDKYIGDAILAFWGEPLPHQDDATRACRAALDQFARLERLCDKWTGEGRPRLSMRIGIETGEAIVGNIGSDLKYNYTVLGDTVNFSSRLESINKLFGTRILIGETTRTLAGDSIIVREIDLLAVAGKTQPVRVYELLGMADDIAGKDLTGYRIYEEALTFYRNREWDEAEQALIQAKEILKTDKASDVLLDRIQNYRVSPPPSEWDGTLILDHK